MSYPIDLDDRDEEKLLEELLRRAALRGEGKCDYCSRELGSKPSCKHPERHATPNSIKEAVALLESKSRKLHDLECEVDQSLNALADACPHSSLGPSRRHSGMDDGCPFHYDEAFCVDCGAALRCAPGGGKWHR
jgi:hypothetical protein